MSSTIPGPHLFALTHQRKQLCVEGGHYEVEENIGDNLGFKANKNLSILCNTVFSNYI